VIQTRVEAIHLLERTHLPNRSTTTTLLLFVTSFKRFHHATARAGWSELNSSSIEEQRRLAMPFLDILLRGLLGWWGGWLVCEGAFQCHPPRTLEK